MLILSICENWELVTTLPNFFSCIILSFRRELFYGLILWYFRIYFEEDEIKRFKNPMKCRGRKQKVFFFFFIQCATGNVHEQWNIKCNIFILILLLLFIQYKCNCVIGFSLLNFVQSPVVIILWLKIKFLWPFENHNSFLFCQTPEKGSGNNFGAWCCPCLLFRVPQDS